MSREIRIGLDFHGVINSNPDYFKSFTQEAIGRGWKIYIITGGPYEKVATYLREHNIEYNHLFAIFDYYQEQGLAEIRPDGEFKIEKELWDKTKATYCREHKIDIHIDDSKEYKKSFSTPYCRYDATTHECFLDVEHKLDLSKSISATLDKIEKFLKE